MECLRLERDQLVERLEFAKGKGSCPYPRPSYSTRHMTPDASSESSISANRSKEQALANIFPPTCPGQPSRPPTTPHSGSPDCHLIWRSRIRMWIWDMEMVLAGLLACPQ